MTKTTLLPLSLIITSCLALVACKSETADNADTEPVTSTKSYTNSDGSEFAAKDYYPKFNWDVTPQYFMFGDINRVLSDSEVHSIAPKTDFLCIEKAHGFRQLGHAELGAKHEVAAFKKINPDAKVLFYFNSALAYPFTSYAQNFKSSEISKYPELESFCIREPDTNELHLKRGTLGFDVLNPDLRKWWSDTVAQGVADSGADGAFIDQMHGFVWFRPSKNEEVRQAMGDMIGDLKKKMPADKILLGNNANAGNATHVYPHVDAIMFEHYNAKSISKEGLLSDWETMLKIAKDGKILIFRIGLEYDLEVKAALEGVTKDDAKNKIYTKLSKELAEYYLACYLIGAQPYSYLQYGWGWTLQRGSLVDHPSFHKPLGKPLAAYKRLAEDGWEFTREFEHASVWVDTEKKESKITWKK